MPRQEMTQDRTAELLHAANKERLAGCHQLADAFMWLLTVNTSAPLPPITAHHEAVQRRRQAVKESFSAHPFAT